MGANSVRVFDTGGTIGRTSDNDWMLPDPERFVSSQHAVITFEAGRYFLTDRSTNGTAVNGREVPKGGRVELRAGDRLTIGTYEIAVSIEQPSMAPSAPPRAPAYDPFSGSDPFFSPAPPVPVGGEDSTLDPLVALGGGQARKPAPPPRQTQDDHARAESAFFDPPRVFTDPTPARSPSAIPENWDQTGFSAPPPAPTPAPPPQARPVDIDEFPPADWADSAPKPAPPMSTPRAPEPLPPLSRAPAGVDLAGLLAAAGLDPAKLDPATVASLGEVLRVVVEGLMGTLKARAEIKNQFRVAMTTLKPVDNNPLKFSVDASDALFNLFGRRNQTFQTPVDAFRDAFADLKDHQVAMMAGMRAAFAELMRRFDPEQLQETFDRGLKRSALLDVINKTKYWDLYREMYASLGDDDTTFRRLFGDEFAQAYEEQMQRLASLRRKR
jgi:type VI secretion system FHA domain protein